MSESKEFPTLTRRQFLKTSATAATALGALHTGMPGAFAAGSDNLRKGLIGCG